MKVIKRKLDSKGTKDKIIELFFEKHIKPVEIAEQVKVGMSYITKIIQKESRKLDNHEKTKEKKRISARNRREREKQEKLEYQKLIQQINKDNEKLSTKKKEDDLQFAKWNRSIYEYDEDTSDLVLKDNINVGFDVAKRVSNIINPNMIKSKKIYV